MTREFRAREGGGGEGRGQRFDRETRDLGVSRKPTRRVRDDRLAGPFGGHTVEGFLEEHLGGGGREDRREREKQELSALHR